MSADGIFVLECPWSVELTDTTTVRPFVHGWADIREVPFSYRMYYDGATLAHGLELFVSDPNVRACYVAGHGNKGRLGGLKKDINLMSLAKATTRSTTGPTKGILFGACDVGHRLQDFLDACGRGIGWVAGYERTVPWMESTICDLLFLEYMLSGRVKRKEGSFLTNPTGSFKIQRASSASQARAWIVKDCGLASLCGLVVCER